MIIEFGAKKILLNTFYLQNQIFEFINTKKFPIDIQIVNDGEKILDTGGGILNLIKNSEDDDFLIFNPDTVWSRDYILEIKKMQNFYFSNNLKNILLITNKQKSFDKNLRGDFNLFNNLLRKDKVNSFIFIGCQILNRSLFNKTEIQNFPIFEIWNEQLKNNKLNGFESFQKFYHLTNLETFKKLGFYSLFIEVFTINYF